MGLFDTLRMLLSSVTTATSFIAQATTVMAATTSELTKSVHIQLAATRKELEQDAGVTSNDILLEELRAMNELNAILTVASAKKSQPQSDPQPEEAQTTETKD